MSNSDLKSSLMALSRDELNIVSKKLSVPNYRKQTKAMLVDHLLQLPSNRLESILNISWWDRHHNHAYGAVTVAGLLATIIFFYLQMPSSELPVALDSDMNNEVLKVVPTELPNKVTIREIGVDEKLLTAEDNKPDSYTLSSTLKIDAIVATFRDVVLLDIRLINITEEPCLISYLSVSLNSFTEELIVSSLGSKLSATQSYDIDLTSLFLPGETILRPLAQVIPPYGSDRFIIGLYATPESRNSYELNEIDSLPSSARPIEPVRHSEHSSRTWNLDLTLTTTVGSILMENLVVKLPATGNEDSNDPYRKELMESYLVIK